MHTEYLETHHLINLDKSNQEIFSGLCQEVGHKDKLEYFCKNHNKLCCSACISKIKENGKGEHHDCEICSIKEIKEEKKNKLNENLKNLEEYSKNIEGSIKELKNIFEKMNENKEEIKLKISNIFTKIRNAINEREEQLLKEVDIIYDNEYFKEDIIKKAEKIPNKIINLMKKGNKIINNGWDDDNSLFAKINDCIIIENNLKNIIEINKNIEEYNSKKINISFIPENEENIEIIKNIKKFGKINSFQFWISQEGHKFVCNHPIPCHTIFIIDKSGSMSRNDISPIIPSIYSNDDFKNRMGKLIENMDNYINKRIHDNNLNDVFSLITFSDEAKIIFNNIKMKFGENFNFINECMKKIGKCKGETEFSLGFIEAEKILNEIDRKKYKPVIILFSDGEDQKMIKTIEIVKRVST